MCFFSTVIKVTIIFYLHLNNNTNWSVLWRAIGEEEVSDLRSAPLREIFWIIPQSSALKPDKNSVWLHTKVLWLSWILLIFLCRTKTCSWFAWGTTPGSPACEVWPGQSWKWNLSPALSFPHQRVSSSILRHFGEAPGPHLLIFSWFHLLSWKLGMDVSSRTL